jgi:hypothetical protein
MRSLLAVLSLGAALVVAAPASASAAAAKVVHLRGTAYAFNDVEVKLGGARIRVAEDVALGATVQADGTYDLKVPDGATVTPYVVAAGYHTVYHQTFTTAGQDLENVNFQTPSDGIYGALRDLLKVPVGADGNPLQCAIVSTFSTRDVRGVPFDAFTGYGAHGVAGAFASASPALPAPVYFNEHVVPDAAQQRSSIDGGVIWPVVPAGASTIRAKGFAPFTATCAPGRIVNASPPWGLHQLGRTNRAKVAFGVSGDRVEGIRATHLPPKATITAARPGRPARTLVRAAKATTITADVSQLGASIRGVVEIRITAPGYDGTLARYANGRRTALCIPLGETRPLRRCPR